MKPGDLTKAEQKWRNRPLFRRRRNYLGFFVFSALLLVLGILYFIGNLSDFPFL
jgi:hypothetical protein